MITAVMPMFLIIIQQFLLYTDVNMRVNYTLFVTYVFLFVQKPILVPMIFFVWFLENNRPITGIVANIVTLHTIGIFVIVSNIEISYIKLLIIFEYINIGIIILVLRTRVPGIIIFKNLLVNFVSLVLLVSVIQNWDLSTYTNAIVNIIFILKIGFVFGIYLNIHLYEHLALWEIVSYTFSTVVSLASTKLYTQYKESNNQRQWVLGFILTQFVILQFIFQFKYFTHFLFFFSSQILILYLLNLFR